MAMILFALRSRCKGWRTVHTNTIEGCFSIFKRDMKGVYLHNAKKHLNSYKAKFDFRYSEQKANSVNDKELTDAALAGVGAEYLLSQSDAANFTRAQRFLRYM
uniref:transposase n=1 Tax=Hyphobacterium marinum TaxID=3116574 RepID=UPI0035A0B99B